MKKAFFASAVATMLLATPAVASDTATDDFNVNAAVPQHCTMESISDINLGSLEISLAAGSGALLLTSPATQASNSFFVSCNDTNLMTLSPSIGVLRNVDRSFDPAIDDAGFKDTINYRVTALNYRSGGGGVGIGVGGQPPGIGVGGTPPGQGGANPGGGGANANPSYSSLGGQSGQTAPRGAIHRQVTMSASVTVADNQDARPLAGTYQETVTVAVSTI